MTTPQHKTATGKTGVQYTVTLRPDRDLTDPDGIRRLRAFLKVALRRWGLRCTGVHPSEPGEPAGITGSVDGSDVAPNGAAGEPQGGRGVPAGSRAA